MSDCDSENAETQVWLEFALACKYIGRDNFDVLIKDSQEVGRLINYMINNPDKFVAV